MPAVLVLLLIGGAALLRKFMEDFRKTSHGENPWTFSGFFNALTIAGHVASAARITGARWNSVFRSPQVQKAVYDGKRKDPVKWAVVVASAKSAGMDVEAYVQKLSTGTRHARALAADFAGKPIGPLGRELFELAKAGRIGPVKKVLDERDHVHVEWYGPAEKRAAPTYQAV